MSPFSFRFLKKQANLARPAGVKIQSQLLQGATPLQDAVFAKRKRTKGDERLAWSPLFCRENRVVFG